MPEVFLLLYGCGLRLSEVLHLRVADVDLGRGGLMVRESKFKDRLVPPALPLVQRLRTYAAIMGDRSPEAYFFPSRPNGPTRFLKSLFSPATQSGSLPRMAAARPSQANAAQAPACSRVAASRNAVRNPSSTTG